MTDINALIAAAAAADDFTKESKGGGFEKELPTAGMGVCRLREYIELGQQETATKAYPNKKPQRKARFVFELTTPKHVKEITKEDKSVIRIPHTIAVTCVVSKSEKSNFIKLFRKLNWAGTAQHPAQLLGAPYLVEIVHSPGNDQPITKENPAKYANVQKDGEYTFAPARKVDPIENTVEEIKVPEMLNSQRLFLYDMPTQECWDALFIDGTYTKDDKEVSKNWMQETIMSALDFDGSALQQMIGGLEDLGKQEDVSVATEQTTASTTSAPKTTSPSDAVTDPLADLGI